MLLQTAEVLTSPWCLVELATALEKEIPIVCVNMVGKGYDFTAEAAHLKDFRKSLEERNPGTVEEIEMRGIDVDALSLRLLEAIPTLMSKSLDTQATKRLRDTMFADRRRGGRSRELLSTRFGNCNTKNYVEAFHSGARACRIGIIAVR